MCQDIRLFVCEMYGLFLSSSGDEIEPSIFEMIISVLYTVLNLDRCDNLCR